MDKKNQPNQQEEEKQKLEAEANLLASLRLPKGLLFLTRMNLSYDQIQSFFAAPNGREENESYADYKLRRTITNWLTKFRHNLKVYQEQFLKNYYAERLAA